MPARLLNLLLLVLLLSACSPAGGGSPTPSAAADTPVPTPVPTQVPTPLVILVLPADMPRSEADRYQTLVYDLAGESGMRFQVRNSLSPAEVEQESPALKIVAALPPDPGLDALAAAAPGVQFLVIGIPGLQAAANVSTIGASGLPVDQQAFLAGYIAGLVAPEWRVGILSRKESSAGDAAVTAFENGFRYYCGDCFNPNFAQPFYHGLYPVIVRIPPDAPERDNPAYANLLIDNFVKVAYLYPEIATPDLAGYMAETGVQLISQEMPGGDLSPSWIASVQPDLISALRTIFPQLAAGSGGQVVSTPLFLAEVNPELLSEAKLRLVQDVLAGLQVGTIGTGVAP